MSRTALRHTLLTAALAFPAALVAQKPTAQAIFDKHAAAVGGLAAFRAAPTRTEIGSADITFAGITGSYESKSAPGKMLLSIDIAGFGQVLQGFDGTTAWAMNPQAGASKMPAATSAEMATSTTPTAGLWEAGSYTTAEVGDAVDFEGAKAWPVKIVTKGGTEITAYYNEATGLKAGELIKSAMGESKVVYADYKPFGALKFATKVTRGTPNGDIVLNITTVKFDPIDAAVFALPDAVKALP